MPMLAFLTLPVIALVGATTTHDFTRGFSHPSFIDALVLSLESSLMSLGLLIVFGTPLGLVDGPRDRALDSART